MLNLAIGHLMIQQLQKVLNYIILTSSLHYIKQVITKTAHILKKSVSRIDLTFTNQPNIVMASGVY